MKIMKLALTLFFLLLTTISFAQIPSYVPSNGLVGWWPFNGNANDESGNGNSGIVNGATPTQDRFGNGNSAYSYNRQTVNEINVNNSGTLNSLYNITISIWVKLVSYNEPGQSGYNHWINKSNQINNHHFVFANNASQVYFYYTGAAGFFATNNLPQLNQWTHIVVTHYYDGSPNSICKFYFDGNLIESIPAIQPLNQTLDNLKIGAFGAQNYNRVDGSLDDIGIWNRALTECEIKDLYYAQLGYSTVDAGADQTVCRGDLVTLQGAGGSSLAWDNGVVDGVPFEPAQSGAYVLTGADSLGCIGTDTVQVTVLENASSTINQTAIDSYTLNGQTYTQSGTYTQVVPAANGCDSVITLNLELDFTGIQTHTNTSLQLYPNPVKDVMTLVGLKGETVAFAVYSVDGKLIKSGQTSGEIHLEDLKKGNYILKIENEALPFVKL